MGYRPQDKHIPTWARTLGGIVDRRGDLRVYCDACSLLMDADLIAMVRLLGRGFSPVNRNPRCKVSGCRKPAMFIVAEHEHALGIPLTHADPFAIWKRHWKLVDRSVAPRMVRVRGGADGLGQHDAALHRIGICP